MIKVGTQNSRDLTLKTYSYINFPSNSLTHDPQISTHIFLRHLNELTYRVQHEDDACPGQNAPNLNFPRISFPEHTQCKPSSGPDAQQTRMCPGEITSSPPL